MYSGGDVSLFLVLLRSLNLTAAILGTVVLMIPVLLTVAAVVLATDRSARTAATTIWHRHRRLLLIVMPIVFIFVIYTVPWTTLAFLGAVLLALTAYYLLRRRSRARKGRPHKVASRTDPDSFVSVIAVVAIFLITPSNMWLPLERVSLASAATRTAYVLEHDGDWTTLLTVEREALTVKSSTIRGREVCATRTTGTLALWIQGGGLAEAPDCREP